VYLPADADFTLHSDDGTTYAYEKGDFKTTKLHWDDAAQKLSHEGAAAWGAPDSEIVDEVKR
jgi:alpha-D-xyloside xylohydrolase